MREVSSRTAVVPNCTGSSRFCCDGTTVICMVRGPSDSLSKQEDPDRAVLEIRWRDPVLVNGRLYDRYFSGIMEKILLKYMMVEMDCYKTIQISFNIAGEARNTLFCAVNAALLALVDAGMPIRSMFYATSSFSEEEEVFVFGDDGTSASHAFGPISDSSSKNAKDMLAYIKESQQHSLKSKFLFQFD